ncbi:MAG: N-acetyltransferase [Clostridiales bacterium]|nr:N-acetyltransferase [Clostridiales bacterium]
MAEKFLYEKFEKINLQDPFFDTLKENYKEFSDWFSRKSNEGDSAFIQLVNNTLEGFLYLKIENGPITDVEPELKIDKALKIGTFKISPHGTRLGERFIKKSLDYAINNNISIVYVTIFSEHDYLIKMFIKFGFNIYGSKKTQNGIENVLVKDLSKVSHDILKDYPLINCNSRAHLLAINPKYHTKLFPDSKLFNEKFDIIKDVSHTNSITKIYIAKMYSLARIKVNDNLVIYRTSDRPKQARFRSVATTICTVEDIRTLNSFNSFDELIKYCKNYSIFTNDEIKSYYNSNQTYYAIKMTYNVSLAKRIIQGDLIDTVSLNPSYWGFESLTTTQFNDIISLGNVNEGYLLR